MQHFTGNVAWIYSDLDVVTDTGPASATGCNSGLCLKIDMFQLVPPDDGDRILGEVNAITCVLESYTSWIIKPSRGEMAKWVQGVVNASLQPCRISAVLKEAVTRPLLKKPSLDPSLLGNYQSVSNIPFLGKVLEYVVVA